MKRLNRWLIEQVLPVWAKAELLRQIADLEEKVLDQEMRIRELNAYATGLEMGLRSQRKIIINNRTEDRK